MPRFVLLYHACPPHSARASHWDLMLEADGTLHTWALRKLPAAWQSAHSATVAHFPQCPPLATADPIEVDRLGDHRLDFLQFEGDLTGNRGQVRRIVSGIYEPEAPDTFSLHSDSLTGQIELTAATLTYRHPAT